MPNFVSVFGVFKPAKEKVYLPDQEKIYEGPDRAAVQMLEENGGSLGTDFRMNMDLVMRAKNLGFKDVQEYLNFAGFNEAEQKAAFEKKLAVVVKHENPKRKAPGNVGRSGGDDTSGQGNHKKGGFGKPAELGGGE